MSVALSIRVDPAGFRALAALTGKARLAAAKALTFTAKDSQLALKATLPGTFHLRNAWVPQGIRIKPATPATMAAQVGSVDRYMARHVVGAGQPKPPARPLTIHRTRDSRGRFGSGGLTIMPYGSIAEYPTHTVVRRRLDRIGTQRRKPFQILSKSGHQVLIVRRKTKARYPLQTLSILRGDAVDIKQQFDPFGSVSATVSARFTGHFERAIGKL